MDDTACMHSFLSLLVIEQTTQNYLFSIKLTEK